jgi:polar amino acid transport system substrate-binding protein
MEPAQDFTTITPGMLKVVTGTTNAPFVWINTSVDDPQARYVGFDVDLMREIAPELNCTVEFTSQPFSSIITSVQAKQYDCAIDSLSITGDRQTRVAFSDPYYSAQQSILVRANDSSINNAGDLVAKNKLICVQTGTTGEAAAKQLPGVKPENIKSYERYNDMLSELALGSVDAIIMDYPINQYYSDIYAGSFKFTGQLFPEKEPYAIVVNKENVKLTAAINAALAKIKADGRYGALLKKYHLDTASAFSG